MLAVEYEMSLECMCILALVMVNSLEALSSLLLYSSKFVQLGYQLLMYFYSFCYTSVGLLVVIIFFIILISS